MMHTDDPLPEVKSAVASGSAVLVDVREKPEWDAGHLKRATLLPLRALWFTRVVPAEIPKDKPLYLHCKAGVRVLDAAYILRELGYDARPLQEGYAGLVEAGFEQAED